MSLWDHIWLPGGGELLVRREIRTIHHRGVRHPRDQNIVTGFMVKEIGQLPPAFPDAEYHVPAGSVSGQELEAIYVSGAWFPVEEDDEGKLTHRFVDAEGRVIEFANEAEYDFHSGRYRRSESGLWVLWFVNWAPAYVAVWASGLEDALEEAAGYAINHAGAAFESDKSMKEAYDEAYKELAEEDPNRAEREQFGAAAKKHGQQELFPKEQKSYSRSMEEEAQEIAEQDLTYTESGWIGPDQWGVRFGPSELPMTQGEEGLLEAAIRLGRLVNGEFYEAEDDG